MLGLTSFSFPIDDIEVDLHRYAGVLVPILRDLHKKHVLQRSSSHEPNCSNVSTPTQALSTPSQLGNSRES